MWIRTTSNRVTDRTSAEKKPTESPVTEGKIVPTLKDKDTRSAEPVGRPQQATSTETPRQTVAPPAYQSTSIASTSPFNPAAHQKPIRNVARTETTTPDPVLSPAALSLAKQLWNDSDEEPEDEMTSSAPKEKIKSNLTTQRHSMETETTSTSLSNHAMPTSSSMETSSTQTRGKSSSYSPT